MDFVLDQSYSESDVISACVRKERWAQRIIYEEYYSKMLIICQRYANNHDDALDILHDGFIKVFRHIAKYKIGTSLPSWIKRIMINTSIDYYRKMVRRRTENLDTAYDLQSTDPDAISRLGAAELIDAIQMLSPTYRTVFNLYVIEGYPHKDIAAELNISESTSRSNLVKARTRLKDILRKKYY